MKTEYQEALMPGSEVGVMKPSLSQVHGFLSICIVVLGIAGISAPAQAAEIFVGTEYRYPTSYEVTPIMGVGPNGMASIAGAIVTPSGFETRMVGAHMVVEATVAKLEAAGAVAAALSDENTKGNTRLMIASSTGDEATVRKLLAKLVYVNSQNNFGSTALMGASAGGYTNIVNMLLTAGADVNAKSKNGSTALMFAAKNGHVDTARMLIRAGAEVNAVDKDGMTALMYGVGAGESDVVKLLLASGAKPGIKDNNGVTPITLASTQDKTEILQLLSQPAATRQ